PHIKHLNTDAQPSYPNLEIELAEWIQTLCTNLKPVSHNMIQVKVAALVKFPQYTIQYPNIDKFKWSSKWLEGFLHYYNFSNHCRTTVIQKLPEELEVIWMKPLAFDMPSNITIDNKGNKTISVRTCGYEKSCFTIVLACIVDGEKLLPTIIFKLKNIPHLEFPSGVKHAWDAIDIKLIKCSFKCCGILVATDESEDDLIFDYNHVENNKVDEYIFSNSKTLDFTTLICKTFCLNNIFISTRPSVPTRPHFNKAFHSNKALRSNKTPLQQDPLLQQDPPS
ncbi:17754_t:CDS:2, partial [Racocetra persica]